MSSPNKITFGNKAANSYAINNSNYGYASGQNIQSSYSPYRGVSTGLNGATTTGYQAYEPSRQVVYGGVANQGYTTGVNYSTVQAGSPSGLTYQPATDVYHPSPTTKITFGGKNYTETYSPSARYQTNNYTPVANYQSYETIQKPVQISTITSQPIRQQVRYQKKIQTQVSTAPKVQATYSTPGVQTRVPEPVTKPVKAKKSGCPGWLWPLLGILALIALIIGLLFGLGVIGGKRGSADAATPSGPTVGPAAGDKNGGYTVVDQTVILSKENKTNPGVPTPVVPITIPTVNPNVTIPTVNPNVTIPTVNPNVTIPTVNPNITIPTVNPNITTPTIKPNITIPTVNPNITTPTIIPTPPNIQPIVKPIFDDFGPVPMPTGPVPVGPITVPVGPISVPTTPTTYPTNPTYPGPTNPSAPINGVPASFDYSAPTNGVPASFDYSAPTNGVPASFDYSAPTNGVPAYSGPASSAGGVPASFDYV